MYLFNYIGIMVQINLPILFCKRCFHKWIPRKDKYPKVCPNCNSPYWNNEYKRGDKIKEVKMKKEKDNRDLGEITELAHELHGKNKEKGKK